MCTDDRNPVVLEDRQDLTNRKLLEVTKVPEDLVQLRLDTFRGVHDQTPKHERLWLDKNVHDLVRKVDGVGEVYALEILAALSVFLEECADTLAARRRYRAEQQKRLIAEGAHLDPTA